MILCHQHINFILLESVNLRIPKLLYSRKDKINTAGPCAKLDSSNLRELIIAVSRCGNKLTA